MAVSNAETPNPEDVKAEASRQDFARRVKHLEGFAQAQPSLYRQRVVMLALLGYAYLALIVVGFLLMTVMATALIISWGIPDGRLLILPFLFLIPIWVVFKSLWVKFSPPEGTRIKRRQAPELFALLDELQRQLKAPKFHRVLVDRDFNASMSQIPRLGLLGWQTNYLLIGLPLMQSLSPDQFRAVLAHEMGHLSGNHSRFSARIYRVRLIWGKVLGQFEEESNAWLLWTVKRFLDWYVPFFNAYSFVLARADEYEADRCAAGVAGKHHCAEALVGIRVKAPQLHDFWDRVSDRTRHDASPPAAYSELMQVLRQPASKTVATTALQKAFEQETDLADTHPCLRDRLTALGYTIQRPEDLPLSVPEPVTAAEKYLGEGLVDILATYDRTWQAEIAEKWQERHGYVRDRQVRLDAIASQTGELTVAERWEQAYFTMEVHGHEAALPLMQAFLDNDPEHPGANYNVGMMLLDRGDASGVEYVRSGIIRRYDWFEDGCQLIYKFWYGQGDLEQAGVWEEYYKEGAPKVGLADHERTRISSRDRFVAHCLDDEKLQSLRQQLAAYTGIERVYLAQKVVKHFPDDRLFVVAIVLKSPSQEEAVMAEFDVELGVPGRQRILALNSAHMARKDLELALQEQKALVYHA
jgi:Zn-dependent protease with chaperone function